MDSSVDEAVLVDALELFVTVVLLNPGHDETHET